RNSWRVWTSPSTPTFRDRRRLYQSPNPGIRLSTKRREIPQPGSSSGFTPPLLPAGTAIRPHALFPAANAPLRWTRRRMWVRRRDEASRAFEADGHRRHVVARAVVLLLDARQQEDLVVHRQPEGDAEHEDRGGRVEGADGGEVESAREVAVLEDPHHGAERGR